ncbi:Nucleolar protein 10-like [Homarus americanus]|uniref:Nucleolar protein 10 n=1 Tax=Homarus americanus TaxID=6706 RepID=A0A8J5K2Z9_HOMAM|nr:Nucleolar protein 10-like [Homarus americanus]
MRALDGRNNVKVYNLSAGKSLPEWLTDRKRRQLSKRDVEFRRRIELIQDFTMPDVSGCVRVSPDGRYILATGTYKPRVKCYEVAALSLKFERCFDAEVIQFEVLSDDYSKLVFLQEERYVELHSQAGRWFRTRIPKFGRDLAYHYPSCDLYIASSGSEIYRLNLNQGRFLNSLQTDAPGVNKCAFNNVHYLFTCGTEDGRVEAWDPRSRHRVGVLSGYKSVKQLGISALAYNDTLTLGVGTQTGQVLLYDIRSDKPLLIKDHNDGFPIKDLEFHNSTGLVLSMSSKMVKIWSKDTGAPHTSIESGVDYNDMCVVPNSGMIFLTTEDTKMQTYFLPSLGAAPRWCSHLDALIEELEEEDAPDQYDDYKFVTEDELKQLGLHDLIGSNMLRAVMHGYYMDVRLYSKAKLIANPFDYNDFMKRKVKQKISEENQRGIQTKKLPSINRDLFERLIEEEKDGKKKKVAAAQALLTDDRFGDLFASSDFQIDKDTTEFKLLNPVLSRMDKKKKKQKLQEEEEEQEFLKARGDLAEDDSSDSDSIMSDMGEDLDVKPKKEYKVKQDSKTERDKWKQIKTESSEKKFTEPSNPLKKKTHESKSLNFTAADSLTELKARRKKLSKMTLADRLDMEDDHPESIKQHTFGSREMNYVVKKAPKFERIKQQQKEHQEERRKFHRSTAKLKGKFKAKDPI